MSAADGGVHGLPASAKGGGGLGDDQASQGNVEGQALAKPGRKSRKSRARVPPLTPEERSEINRRNATKHGRYVAEQRMTVELCERLNARYWYQQRWLDRHGVDWRDLGPRPPEEEVCEEWRNDSLAWARWIIATFGPRISYRQRLKRIDERQPWAPGNVAGWQWDPPATTKAQQRWSARTGPLDALRGCVCDDRAQEICASSGSPCEWAEAAVWSCEPPRDPGTD